jgi:O-antigen ligase
LYRKEYGEHFVEPLVWNLFFVGTIHSTIMVTAFLSPDFRDMLYQYVALSEEGEAFVLFNLRSPGLTSGGGAALSVTQAAMLICGSFAALESRKQYGWFQVGLFTICVLLLLTSVLLSGRTGMVVLMLWIIINLMLSPVFLRRIKRNAMANLGKFFVLASCMVVVLYFVDYSKYDKALSQAFEFYYNWEETGIPSTESSSEIISTMYFFPSNLMDLFFGTSNFGRGSRLPYLASDVGYVRFIFGIGLIGTILCFAFYILIFLQAIRIRNTSKILSILLVYFVFTVFVVNFKELFFVQIQGWTQMFFILTVAASDIRIATRQDKTVNL